MSQRFLNLIRTGQTAEVAAAAEEDPSLIACRDAQGVSAFLWSIYHGQPLIRDFLLGHLPSLDIFEASRAGGLQPHRTAAATGCACWSMKARPTVGRLFTWRPRLADPQATALLLAHGAHVHRFSRNPMHNQPLHACIALSRNCETVRLLIEQGADVNMDAGRRVHAAAPGGGCRTRRCDPDPARRGEQIRRASAIRAKTPADYARERQHDAVVQQLSAARA